MTREKELDEVDLRILKQLRADARISFREIGKKVKVSTGTVSERVRQMERAGTIKGFTTIVAPARLGYNVTMLVEIRVTPDRRLDTVDQALRKLEEVCCIQYVTGDIDMMVLLRCKDQDHATESLNKVRTLDGVSWVESHVVLKSSSLCNRCGCECAWEPSPVTGKPPKHGQ